MNSVLQCLNNTPGLADHMLTGRYIVDLNEANPLGHGGKLAAETATLVQLLWSNRYTACAPVEFKGLMGKLFNLSALEFVGPRTLVRVLSRPFVALCVARPHRQGPGGVRWVPAARRARAADMPA